MMTRRAAIRIAVGCAAWPLSARVGTDFWRAKPPSQWTSSERGWMLAKSPWTVSTRPYFTRTRGSAPRTVEVPLHRLQRLTVRWESAEPVWDALQMQIPGEFRGHYVLNILGPSFAGPSFAGPSFSGAGFSGAGFFSEAIRDQKHYPNALADLRGARLKIGVQQLGPERVEEVLQGASRGLLFYFPRAISVSGDPSVSSVSSDDDITFVTAIHRVEMVARFQPKQMLYRGHLAV